METELELTFDYVLILKSFYEDFKIALHDFNIRDKQQPKLAALDLGEIFRACSSSACPGGELEVEEEGTAEVELVSIIAFCTDSSLGFAQNPHMSM